MTAEAATFRCTGETAWPIELSRLQNPVTKAIVAVEPPVTVTSDAELDAICQLFYAYCKTAWDGHPAGEPLFRLDPKVIGADWLKWKAPEPDSRQDDQS